MRCIYTYILFLSFAFMLVFFTACQDDTSKKHPPIDNKSLIIDFLFDNLETRSTSITYRELELKDVTLIFYDADNNSYVTHYKNKITPGNEFLTLKLPEKIQEEAEYKIIALGNFESYLFEGKSIDQYISEHSSYPFETMRTLIAAQSANQSRVITPLPFSGVLIDSEGRETLFVAPKEEIKRMDVKLKFTASVARFNLYNLRTDRLVIESVKVGNYRDKGYFYQSDTPIETPIITGLGSNTKGVVADVDVIDGRQVFNKGGLYSFPNTVKYITPDDKAATCLLIAGYYQTEGERPNRTKLTYYRANIGENAKHQIIRRNHIYSVILTGIKGKGAETEEQALVEGGDVYLEYEVEDNWDNDDKGVVTDNKGNFIMLSRTFLILDSTEGVNEYIKVGVKRGATWSIQWEDNSGAAADAFDYKVISDHSFNITTKRESSETSINEGVLVVSLDGTDLSIKLHVIQSVITGEIPILLVEGKRGTLEYNIPGEGQVLILQILTGGDSGWDAKGSEEFLDMTKNYTKEGANKSLLNIAFAPNITNTTQVGQLIVSRSDENKEVDDVILNFTQNPTKSLISISPEIENNILEIEGFSTSRESQNGLIFIKKFWVNLVDRDNYNFEISTTFNKDVDAFAFVYNDPIVRDDLLNAKALYGGRKGSQIEDKYEGVDGDAVYFCVYRTGPGDKTLNGNIVLKTIPKGNSNAVQTEEYIIPVVITSSCNTGDIQLDNYYIVDRNIGTKTKFELPVAGNYNYTNKNHPDYNNRDFRGVTYPTKITDYELKQLCEKFVDDNYDEYGIPNIQFKVAPRNFHEILNKHYYISKERMYFLSDNKDSNGGYVGAYLPGPMYYWGETYITNRLYRSVYKAVSLNGLDNNTMANYGYAPGTLMGDVDWFVRCIGTID